jgi:hypothetical protein
MKNININISQFNRNTITYILIISLTNVIYQSLLKQGLNSKKINIKKKYNEKYKYKYFTIIYYFLSNRKEMFLWDLIVFH